MIQQERLVKIRSEIVNFADTDCLEKIIYSINTRRDILKKVAISKFNVGDIVKWKGRDSVEKFGKIDKLMIKNIRVKVPAPVNGKYTSWKDNKEEYTSHPLTEETWIVPATMLTLVNNAK